MVTLENLNLLGGAAVLEEIFHNFSDMGYCKAYPTQFCAKEVGLFSLGLIEVPPLQKTLLMDAMIVARAGDWGDDTPSEYPAAAWYKYTEPSCVSGCQLSEYAWHAFSSYINYQAFNPAYATGIASEWSITSRA